MLKLLVLLVPFAACVPSSSQMPQRGMSSVAQYRTWVRVNAEPLKVGANLAMLCRSLTSSEQALLKSPHRDRWVTVYVNPIAKQVMLGTTPYPFPRGSIIVKEKALRPDGPPELLTVMHKREAGYNPASGDWEYLVFNGNGTRVTDRGRIRSCQSCHAQWRQSDYVSRFYLIDGFGETPMRKRR